MGPAVGKLRLGEAMIGQLGVAQVRVARVEAGEFRIGKIVFLCRRSQGGLPIPIFGQGVFVQGGFDAC